MTLGVTVSGPANCCAEYVFGVTVDSLASDNEPTSSPDADREAFVLTVNRHSKSSGKKEAEALLERASAIFNSRDLDEDAKDEFFQSMTSAILTAMKEARKTYRKK